MTDTPDRMEVRFDPETLRVWPVGIRRRTATNTIGTVTHFVENTGNRTPSGGRFVSKRFTVMIDGQKWYGQVRKDSDIVRLRLANGD